MKVNIHVASPRFLKRIAFHFFHFILQFIQKLSKCYTWICAYALLKTQNLRHLVHRNVHIHIS